MKYKQNGPRQLSETSAPNDIIDRNNITKATSLTAQQNQFTNATDELSPPSSVSDVVHTSLNPHKVSSAVTTTATTTTTLDTANVPHKRVRRVQIFRPLFVYRQQRIEKKRLTDKRRKYQRRKAALKTNNVILTSRKNVNRCRIVLGLLLSECESISKIFQHNKTL